MTVDEKLYRKKEHVPVKAIQFTGGAESVIAINEFLKRETGVTAKWSPETYPVIDRRGNLVKPSYPEYVTLLVGSHTIRMDLNDYFVLKDEDAFGIEDPEMFESRYEEIN
jgi:hypothetical protein